MKKSGFIFLVLFCVQTAVGQEWRSKIDSIVNLEKASPIDPPEPNPVFRAIREEFNFWRGKKRCDYVILLAQELRKILKKEENKLYIDHELSFCDSNYRSKLYVENFLNRLTTLENCSKYTLLNYSYYGYVGHYYSNNQAMLFFVDHVKKQQNLALKQGCKEGYVKLVMSESYLLILQHREDEVLKIAQKALLFAEKEKLGAQAQIDILNVLIKISHNIKDFEKTIEYSKKDLALQKQLNDSVAVAASMNNLGYFYKRAGKLQEAKAYFTKTINLAQKIGSRAWINIATGNLGSCYFSEGNYQEAIPLFLMEYENTLGTPEESSGFLSIVEAISCFIKLGDLHQAEKYLLIVEKKLQNPFNLSVDETLTLKKKYLESICSFYEKKQDYLKSLHYYKQYISLRDSTEKNNMVAKVQEIQTAYEVEKKNKENLLLQQANIEKDNQIRQQNIGVSLGLVALILAIGLIYLLYRDNKNRVLNNKILYKKNKELEIQNQLIEQQND